MKRYIVGVLPHGNVGMALEGEPEAVFERIMRIIKEGPAVCWQITTDSPFGNQR